MNSSVKLLPLTRGHSGIPIQSNFPQRPTDSLRALGLRWLFMWLMAIPLAGLAGCHHIGSGEEEDHLEHHDPEHKPKSFKLAVEELRVRILQPEEATSAESVTPAAVRRSELIDIINWLPELAAQTDLKKPVWDRIKAISMQLLEEVPPADTSPPGIDDTKRKKIAPMLEELERFVQTESQ